MLLVRLLVVGLLATETVPVYQTRSDHVTSRAQEERISDTSLGITDKPNARQLLPYAISLIEDFESWVPKPYNDASNYCTIGFGHLIAKASCVEAKDRVTSYDNPLSKSAGRTLLDQDTALARASISKAVKVSLNDQQFGALASFVFNVGAENFRQSTLLQYTNAGAYKSASREFGRWVKSKNKVLDGLVRRRACEAALFSGKLPVGDETSFRRSSCSALGAVPNAERLIDIDRGEQ